MSAITQLRSLFTNIFSLKKDNDQELIFLNDNRDDKTKAYDFLIGQGIYSGLSSAERRSLWNKFRKNFNFNPNLDNFDFTKFSDILSTQSEKLNLSNLNLSKTNFSNLLITSINFSESDLSYSDFSNSTLNMSDFLGVHVNSGNFSTCTFNEIDFRGSIMAGSKFDKSQFRNRVIFNNCNLMNATFKKVYFKKMVTFTKANLTGVQLELENDALSADFEKAILVGVEIKGLNMYMVEFNNSDLSNSKLINCFLSQTDFGEAKLNNTDFTGSTLWESNFAGAKLNNTNFKDADLRHAQLFNIDLSLAINLPKNMNQAYINETTAGYPKEVLIRMGCEFTSNSNPYMETRGY